MARIVRKFQKIFALNATNNGVFGSGQDNTKILSQDLTVLQSKAAFLTGWLDATISAREFPPLEEFQSLMYIATSQIAYLFQEGIPEYDASTTYYQKSVVKQTGTYQLYGSKTDANVGNALADTVNWLPLIDLSATVAHATTAAYGTVQLAVETDLAAGSTATTVPTAAQVSAHGFVTGDWKGTTLSTLQAGWIWGAGTIGNASSNATSRANADTLALFTAYWGDAAYNYTGSTATGAALQVYDSSGTPVAKGANAAADYAANRAIAVVDFRDRVVAARGNMVGSAGRLSGQPHGVSGNGLGNSGGEESHTLLISELAAHGHSLGDNSLGVLGVSNVSNPYNFGGGTRNFQGFTATGNAGSDAPHNNVQPTIITNIIIKL